MKQIEVTIINNDTKSKIKDMVPDTCMLICLPYFPLKCDKQETIHTTKDWHVKNV